MLWRRFADWQRKIAGPAFVRQTSAFARQKPRFLRCRAANGESSPASVTVKTRAIADDPVGKKQDPMRIKSLVYYSFSPSMHSPGVRAFLPEKTGSEIGRNW